MDTHLALPEPASIEPAELKKSIDLALARYPDAEFNPDAKAKELGADAGAVFSFVRDSIRYEAYAGVLRGFRGAYTARAANSFDRSLLLARMLNANGIQTRFAHGELSRESAQALFSHIFDGNTSLTLDDSDSSNTFLTRVIRRARRDYPIVKAALGVGSPLAAQKARAQALADAQRHVWVQASINGQWVNLDSAFPDATPGKNYCPPKGFTDLAPAEWHQKVVLRVTAERFDSGKLTTEQVLTLTASAVDLIDEVIFVTHVPARKGGGGLGLGAGAATSGTDAWTPVLIVGNKTYSGVPVEFGEPGGGSLADALGGGDESAFVAEWLEIEVIRPDGRRDLSRRALTNRASPSWRAAASPDPSGLQPLERDDGGLFAPRALHNVLMSAGPHDLNAYARSVAWSASEGQPRKDAPPWIRLFPIALLNYAALIWSDHLIVPTVNNHSAVRLYSDSPRIFIVSNIPMANQQGFQLYDLRRDRLLGLSRDAQSDSLVEDRKLWFAALEGALEHEAVARDAVFFGADASTVVSTSARLSGDGVVGLGPADINKLGKLTSDQEKIARLTETLKAGNRLVIPRSSLTDGPLAFWEISENGDARAVDGSDFNGSGMLVSYNPIPRSAPRVNIVYTIDVPGFKGGESEAGTGRAGTEYLGIVIVIVDLIGSVYLLQAIITQRIESARIELETDAIIADARRRQQAAGGS